MRLGQPHQEALIAGVGACGTESEGGAQKYHEKVRQEVRLDICLINPVGGGTCREAETPCSLEHHTVRPLAEGCQILGVDLL